MVNKMPICIALRLIFIRKKKKNACAHLVEERRKKKLFSSPLSDIWIFIAFFASNRYSRFIPMRKIFFIQNKMSMIIDERFL